MRAYLFSRLRLQRRSLVGTGLAVALAVAFVVVVLGATSTLKEFVGNGAAPRARAATVVAVPDPERDFVWPTAAQVAAVRALPDVAAVSAVQRTSLQLAWPDGVLPSLVESAPDDPGLAWYEIVDGRAPARAGEVLVDRRSAADLGVRVGTRLQVAPQKGARLPADLVVAGLFRAQGPQPVSRTVLAREPDVVAWAARADADGEEPLVEEVDVLARPGADVAGLVAAVEKIAPTLRVEPAAAFVDAQVRQQTQDVDVLGRLVLGFTAVATLVAAIVIANTFTILLAQRARDLALLRCVGATRRQLRRATRVEATVLGLVASAVGALLGAVVLLGGTVVAAGTVGVLAGLRPRLGTSDVLLPVLLGLVVTVGASVLPTRRATRVAPLAALRPDTAVQVRRTSRLRLLAGALLGTAGGAALAAGLALGGGGGTGVLVSAAGGMLLVLAVVLVSPVLVPAVTRLVGAPLVRLGPVARIAVGSTRRNATRSAATSTALFVGVCLISVLSVGAATTVQAVEADLGASRPVDVALMTGAEGMAKPVGLPARAVEDVARVPGVTTAVGLRGVQVAVAGTETEARRLQTAAAAEGGGGGVLGADPAALRATFRGDLPLTDSVVLVPDTGVPDGVRDGAPVVLVSGERSARLTARVLPHLPAMLVSSATLDRLGAGDAVLSLWARTADGVDPVAVSGGIDKAVRSAGLVGLGGAQPGASGVAVADFYDQGGLAERASVVQVMNILLLVSTGLLAVALVISLVGIANTLSLSVLERARESAVSRAIGMTRRQLRVGLAVEAGLLAVVGCLLGVVVGAGLGWAGSVSLLHGVAPVAGPVVPLGRIAAVIGVALLAAVLASVLPGRRAAGVSPTEALAQV